MSTVASPKTNARPPGGGADSKADPPRMSLASVQSGRVRRPPRVLLYGPPGIGKSTWGAGAPAPIFLPVEAGSDQLDVPRFPQPQTLDEAKVALRALREEPHEYQTVVLDTVDALEPLIWRAVCKAANVTSIEDVGGGYGKGYIAAMDEWLILIRGLELLRERRGMTVVLLAHADVKNWKNPVGPDYDRFQLRLNAKAGAKVIEWCDDVLFANLAVATEKTGKGKWAKAKPTGGVRKVYTQTSPSYEAKNRHALPPTLELDFGDYLAAVEKAQPAETATIQKAIKTLTDALADEAIGTWVASELARKPTPARLAQIRDRLAAKMEMKEQASADARAAEGAEDEAAAANHGQETGREPGVD